MHFESTGYFAACRYTSFLILHKPLLFLQSETHLHTVIVFCQRGEALQLGVVALAGQGGNQIKEFVGIIQQVQF